MKPTKQTTKTESFTIGFSDVTPTQAKLNLIWDDVLIPISMTADIDSRVMAGIQEAMKGDQKPYAEAAAYYYENGKDLKKALEWITAADDQKSPWFKYWKAKIQLKAGDKAGAQASAKAGIEAAKAMNLAEYVRLNSAILAEAAK